MEIGPHSQRLNAYQVGCFLKPCVYAWRRGQRWLYVGKSMNGLARLGGHHVISIEKVEPNDEVLIWWGPTTDAELTRLEALLILKHKPKFNRAKPRLDAVTKKLIIRRAHRPPTRTELRQVPPRPQARFPIPVIVGEVPSGSFRIAKNVKNA